MAIAYSFNNRSAATSIPVTGGQPAESHIEIRFPDPACNPYLAFSFTQ